MIHPTGWRSWLIGISCAVAALSAPTAATSPSGSPPARSGSASVTVPVVFVKNAGQLDSRVAYSAHAGKAAAFLTQDGVTFAFVDDTRDALALRLTFVGGAATRLEPSSRRAGTVNYLAGADSSKWASGVPAYQQLLYRDVWPGIDAAVRAESGRFKYEFRVAPGADPARIRLRYTGTRGIAVDDRGALRLDTARGALADDAPTAFQGHAGSTAPVAAAFSIRGDGEYGFSLGSYDRTQALVIDPAVLYATYLGGNDADAGNAVAADTEGNVYVAGSTRSIDFPTTVGVYQPTLGGRADAPKKDAFVAKLSADGSSLLYSTYLGGTNDDEALAIAVDGGGNAYVAGTTYSSDFPVTAGAFQTSLHGQLDGFVAKLNPSGDALVYSTFIGGSNSETANAIAIDSAGRAYVTGRTESSDLPGVSRGVQWWKAGGQFDAYVIKLNPGGDAAEWGTYFGDLGNDVGNGIAIDGNGHAYVAGETSSFELQAGGGSVTRGWSPVLVNDNVGEWRSGYGVRAFTVRTFGTVMYHEVYAGTEDFGIFKTASGGWISASNGLPRQPSILSIVVDPAQPNTLYASVYGPGGQGVYKSTDAAGSWVRSAAAPATAGQLAIDPLSTSTLYYATGLGLFKSTDAAATWTNVNSAAGLSIAVDPANPSILYYGANSGVFKSANGGVAWTAVNNGLPASSFMTIRVLVVDRSTGAVYAGLENGLYKSLDGAASWSAVPEFWGRTIWAMSIDPLNSKLYVVPYSAGNVMSTSVDHGSTWQPVPTLNRTHVQPMAVLASNLSEYVGMSRGNDAFVAHFDTNASGDASLVSTRLLSGTGNDSARAITRASDGYLWITGTTDSGDFPTNMFYSVQSYPAMLPEAFLTKMDGTGYTPWGSYLPDFRSGQAVVTAAPDRVYVAGTSTSGAPGAIVGELTPNFVWNRIDLGAGSAGGAALARGNLWVTGTTTSLSIPSSSSAPQQGYHGVSDAFLAQFSIDPNPPDIVIWAADVPAGNLHGSWSLVNDPTAAGGVKLSTIDAGVAVVDPPLGQPTHYFDVQFEAPARQPYHLWLRLHARGETKWNDSVYVQFNDAVGNGGYPAYQVYTSSAHMVNLENCSGCGVNGWGWQDKAWWTSELTTVSFAGTATHTLRVQVREDGVEIDQIVLSPQKYMYVAPGAVRNDTTIVARASAPPPPPPPPNQPPSVAITGAAPEGSGQPVAPAWMHISASASDSDGAVTKVVFFGDGQTIGTDTNAPYETTWGPLAAGSHTVYAEATDDKGATTRSSTTTLDVQQANIVLYAADVADANVHGAWTKVPDASAGGGVRLSTIDNGAATVDAPPSPPRDYFLVTFDAPANTPYHLWLRMRGANDSKWNESVWVQFSDARVNNSPQYLIGATSGLLVNLEDCSGCGIAGWGWQDNAWWLTDQPTVSFASAGPHTLQIQVREDGVSIDQIVLSPTIYLNAAPGPVRNDSTIVPKRD
jgi:hypothetical protein